MVENGNLQKKMQPYAADKLERFKELTSLITHAATQSLGPGTYNVMKALPPAPTLPYSSVGRDIEAPIK